MTKNSRVDLDGQMVEALRRLRFDAISVTAVPGLAGLDSDRATLRVAAVDGRIVKLRRATRPAKAIRYVRLVRSLDGLSLSRVLLRRGRVVVEEWIEGRPLDTVALTPQRLRAAADLLAAIHAARAPRRRHTRTLLDETEARVTRLAAAGTLTRSECTSLRRRIRDLAPASSVVGLAHNDFCAENLVEDRRGRLHAIDNAGLAAGFLELDLARSWVRWPMSPQRWRSFLAHYERRHPRAVAIGEIEFWRLLALIRSVHFRVRRRSPGVAAVLEPLRAMLGESRSPPHPAFGRPLPKGRGAPLTSPPWGEVVAKRRVRGRPA